MPRVPDYEPVSTPRPLPIPSAGPPASVSDAGLAVTHELRRAGAAVFAVGLEHQEDKNAAAALELDNAAAEAENQLLWSENGALRVEGLNAEGASKKALEAWESTSQSLLSRASSPPVRMAVQKMIGRRRQAIAETLERHVFAQTKQALTDNAAASRNNAIRDAAKDPARAQDELAHGYNVNTAQGLREGWGTQELKDSNAAFATDLHVGVINGYIERQEYDQASAYLEAHGDEIDLDKRTAVRDKIEQKSEPAIIENHATTIWQEAGGDYNKAAVLLEKVPAKYRADVRNALNARQSVVHEAKRLEREDLFTRAYNALESAGSYERLRLTAEGREIIGELNRYGDVDNQIRQISDSMEATRRAARNEAEQDAKDTKEIEATKSLQGAYASAANDPYYFIDIPVVETYGGVLGKQDLEQLLAIQFGMRQNVARGIEPLGDPSTAGTVTIETSITSSIAHLSKKQQGNARAVINRALNAESIKLGRKLTPEEAQPIIDGKMIYTDTWGPGGTYAYQKEVGRAPAIVAGPMGAVAMSEAEIPPDARRLIIEAYKDSGVANPTEAQIQTTYLQGASGTGKGTAPRKPGTAQPAPPGRVTTETTVQGVVRP